ncbi:MAG: asparagine synthase (glutamine-hydrolyzing), partial [Deltaproteobacteria bacterium]|nr:asparagine synthase (glutamine-hydrolyzing) [Deltaproteobacteria bacterium]
MCGIFGLTHPPGAPESILQAMGKILAHRGPDGEGSFVSEEVALGMRRLSILDPTRGQQPFYNQNRTVGVVCNGEIYNFIELRSHLMEKGYRFQTNCDVEVIPHLYEEYGIAFVHRLNGMYGMAIYDLGQNILYLIRDRLGVKPLYYSLAGRHLIFASEIKALFQTDLVAKEIDLESLSVLLDLMYLPAPATPFSQIKKLPPGSYLKWRAGVCELVPYWTMALPEACIQDEPRLAETLEGLLEDSVRLQMRSDVPIGCFLSGGIDSSAVTALASLQTSLPMTTWHVRGTDMQGKMDESPLAAAVSRRYGTRHFTKSLADEDLITELPKLIWHLEEPIGDGAFVLTYGLAKMAAEKVKVILSGAGGDELFGGYAHYRNLYFGESLIKRLLFDKQVESSYYDRMAPRHASRWPEYFPWHRVSVSRKEEFDHPVNANRSQDPLNALMLADLRWY